MELLIGGLIIGMLVGVVFSIIRHCGFCRFIIDGIVSIIRGTPLLLQLSIIYFVLPKILGCRLDLLATGIIAFGLNSSAYMAEIMRAGIESLPKGQFEAAQTLEISTYGMWRDIILPQVLSNIWPAFVNEAIALLKETALIATIGGMDITRRSQVIAAEQYDYFTPLCIAGALYYVLVLLIEFCGKKIEKRNRHAKN
jgi:polar amino acid transport system permease protein